MISLIIPCYNEKSNICRIKKNISFFKRYKYLIIDGGSKDGSEKLYIKNKLKFIKTSASRGLQQKHGAKKSCTNWLFFLHADSEIKDINMVDIEEFIQNQNNINKVAYFKLLFNEKKTSAKIIAMWANLRTLIFKLPFGDQGLIISKDYYFKLGGHSDKVIMEDIEFILKIPKKNRILLKSKIISSFRRFRKNGVFLQGTIHLLCQLLFFLNFNQKVIFKVYKRYE